MKGSIGTSTHITYLSPKLSKSLYKFVVYLNLTDKAKIRYKAIDLYERRVLGIKEICEVFEISRVTFYRWRKRYKRWYLQSLEDKSRRPKRLRKPTVTVGRVERIVCKIRKENPGLGKEKIKVILKRDWGIEVSSSSVGRILKRYKTVLPGVKGGRRRKNRRKGKRICPKDVKKDVKGDISEWLQVDMFEMLIKRIKIYIFVAVDKISRVLYMRAYKRKSSRNSADFLKRLRYVHNNKIRYIQVDNGSEFEGEFENEICRMSMDIK